MNKFFFSLRAIRYFIVVILSCLLANCSEDLDYRKACADKNWEKAYQIVDIFRDEAQKYYEKYASANGTRYDWALEAEAQYTHQSALYQEGLHYVVLQEALCVLEDNGESGIMRIVGIAKEHDAESWLYEELLDAAKKIGDEELANRFEKIINGNGE